MQALELLEISPPADVRFSIIWLHGLGADGYDFESIAEALRLPQTRFILPHAPYRKVTINNGYEMRAWYDIFSLEPGSKQDEQGIRESQAQIEALIRQEMARGIPSDHIVLAGFSQGGAVALHTALRFTEKLAGVLALSTYLPLRDTAAREAAPINARIPVFMAHGQFDSVIRPDLAKNSATCLSELGYPLTWHEYGMAHAVCQEEISDIRQFLTGILPFGVSTNPPNSVN
ncbi:lysophospholipase II [Methylophilaceae bacterium]|nr:lysophospholipase II [Methylophilaceae bacterium]